MELTELMRNARPNVADRLPDRHLPIADHPHHRHAVQLCDRLVQQPP